MKITPSTLNLALCLGLATSGAVIGITGCAGDRYERSTGQYIDDKSINARVRDALGDNSEYKFSDVNVDTFRGVVQLSGFVDTSAQKSRAGDLAGRVQGVKSVQNNITVKEDGARTTGQYVDDKVLTARVNSALNRNPEYKFDGVNVTTFRGTVQLNGFVNTSDQKSKAAAIAKGVEGVKNVENSITVKDKMN
jgi:hyperosmotically inducible protein